MLSCEICETFKNDEHLQTTAFRGALSCFQKLCNIQRTKVASDKGSVKKVLMVAEVF